MKNKKLGTRCIDIMEESLKLTDSIYKSHRTYYENEVLRIANFIISYFNRKICETREDFYSIQVFLTSKETVCIGNPHFPVKELSSIYAKNSSGFEKAFYEVIDFLRESKNYEVHESENLFENAIISACSISYRPKS